MITAYFTDISDGDDRIFSRLLSNPDSAIRESVLVYKEEKEQLVRLCGRFLLKKMLSVYDETKEFSLDNLKYNKYGKPYFSNNFDFNISHSGDIIICAGSKNGRIGVDVELEKHRDIDSLQEYFTGKEWNKIKTDEHKETAFYDLWVRKEACLKGAGKGLLHPLHEIDVCKDEVMLDHTKWFLYDLHIKPGYAACIAASEPGEMKITKIDINTLIN